MCTDMYAATDLDTETLILIGPRNDLCLMVRVDG